MKLLKLSAVLLALMLALCCAGCNRTTDPQTTPTQIQNPSESLTEPTEEPVQVETVPDAEHAILGSWVAYIYITEENTGLEGFQTDAGLPALITFHADGTATMVAYRAGLEDAYDVLTQDLSNYMMELMYSQMEEAGYSREAVDARFEDIYGTSLTEYAGEAVERLGLHDAFLRLDEDARYTIETREDGSRVLILNGKQELTFLLCRDTLTFLDSTNAQYWEAHGMEFPVTLVRPGLLDTLKGWF